MTRTGMSAGIDRREFLIRSGALSALAASQGLSAGSTASTNIVLILDGENPSATSQPVRWALSELLKALHGRRLKALVAEEACQVQEANFYLAIGARSAELRQGFPGIGVPTPAEAFTLAPGKLWDKPALLVDGSDARGLMYALLEVAERVHSSLIPTGGLSLIKALEEKPANQIRSISRAFVSDVEDKSWYYDRQFWRSYLAELAMSRINRFCLNFGLSYNFPRNVTGDYFQYTYPYLFEVPGYNVRAVPLSDSERDKNFETLKFITAETKAHGLQCQVGLWTHAYQWTDSPHSDHHIEGLNDSNHAAYSRDALALLLKACPEIEGVTMRVHGESGIPEGSYDFWEKLFEAFPKAGRKIEIDMHAKGLDARMIDIAVKTGMPVKVSPKFWAEHLGLGYHQTAIRELEMPREEDAKESVFKLSNGARRFLRYGYGDLFEAGRKYDILFRIWPGTQKTLLWGDPALAAGIGNASHFCGAAGVDIFEPLFFKGREGTGLPGGRCGYLDESLNPKEGEWAKFRYTYRVWGRYLYNPKADRSETRKFLTEEFGGAAQDVETSLANASRILPLWTTAHLPSASNRVYWPELYTNMPIVQGSTTQPYGDTPEPKRFGTVSPLDPAMFSSIREHAKDLVAERANAKYSPLEVGVWIEKLASAADLSLSRARRTAKSDSSPAFRRVEEDVRIQSGLGHFFGHKLRSGVFYELYLETKDRASLEAAIIEYEKARAAWERLSSRAANVYRKDLTFGSSPVQRGHWADRLAGIDKDLLAMKALLSVSSSGRNTTGTKALALAKVPPIRPEFKIVHQAPASFRPAQTLLLSLTVALLDGGGSIAVIVHYRHVNQAERWQQSAAVAISDGSFTAEIDGAYTRSAYPLQYYFEVRSVDKQVTLYPGFNSELNNQPYFVLQSSAA